MGAAIEKSDITVVPASADRFDDVATMLAPKTAGVVACWCLVYRLDAKTNRDLPVWSLWCLKVRPGHRGRGVSLALIDGAVQFAFEHGAPAVESYPMDAHGRKVDTTAAFVGTRSQFEAAGFSHISDTDATSATVPRILMRRQR